MRGYASQNRLNFLGMVSVEFETDNTLRTGLFRLHPSYDERVASAEPGGWLEGPDGAFYRLKNSPMTIGRLATCDVVIDDQNVSRQHAELHPTGDTFELVDLGSTNGCRVNGTRIERHVLADADEIAFGPVRLRFRRS